MRHPSLCLLGVALAGAAVQPARAASEAACIWMMNSPSTRATGMGNTFSPLSNDPFNAWLAPGSEVSRPEGSPWLDLSLTGYPGGLDWLPAYRLPTSNENFALTLQIDLLELRRHQPNKPSLSQPRQVSLAYHRILFDKGHFVRSFEAGSAWRTVYEAERSHSLCLGLGQSRERWAAGLGLGVDRVISDLGFRSVVGNPTSGTGRSTTFDVGLNLQAKPIPRQFIDPYDPAAGCLDWTVGLQYSKLFFGPKISYNYTGIGDPMPFHDQLGLARRWRWVLPHADGLPELPYLELHLALERAVQLIRTDRHWTVNGERDMTDVGYPTVETDPRDAIKHENNYIALDERLFFGNSNRVDKSAGWEAGVLGTLFVRGGWFLEKDGQINEHTRGWGFSSEGLTNWILRLHPDPSSRVCAHPLRSLQLRYDHARTDSHSPCYRQPIANSACA